MRIIEHDISDEEMIGMTKEKFIEILNERHAEEISDYNTYTKLAGIAVRLGLHDVSINLTNIALDEDRHSHMALDLINMINNPPEVVTEEINRHRHVERFKN